MNIYEIKETVMRIIAEAHQCYKQKRSYKEINRDKKLNDFFDSLVNTDFHRTCESRPPIDTTRTIKKGTITLVRTEWYLEGEDVGEIVRQICREEILKYENSSGIERYEKYCDKKMATEKSKKEPIYIKENDSFLLNGKEYKFSKDLWEPNNRATEKGE